MMLKDVIREARSEHEIFLLLTYYIEALRQCDRVDVLPEHLKRVPLLGADDLRTRLERITADLVRFQRQGESWPRRVFEEAADVFNAALKRLQRLATAPRQAVAY